MACVWFVSNSHWQVHSVDHELPLSGRADAPIAADADSAVARITALAGAGEPTWVLHAAAAVAVRINGNVIPGGLAVLADRDLVQIGAASVVVNTMTPPAIAEYAGPHVVCPRCRRSVSGPAVICPNCRSVFHQSDAFGCWLYSPHCQKCQHPTSLEQPQWRPDPEEQ